MRRPSQAIGTPDAEAKVDAIEAEWATFEGTVRDTDPDIYLAIEDQLDPVQDQIKAGRDREGDGHGSDTLGAFHPIPVQAPGMMRRLLVAVVGVMAGAAFLAALPSTPASAATSRDDAIAEVQNVRVSIDLTLSLIKQGRSAEAFTAAANGYLNHFELVEVPLRIIDNDLTIETEGRFADIRQLIRNHAPVDRIRDELIGLRGALDTIERKLTATGAAAPALIFGQSFLIIFREGFEVVLLVSILLGYLRPHGQRHSSDRS